MWYSYGTGLCALIVCLSYWVILCAPDGIARAATRERRVAFQQLSRETKSEQLASHLRVSM